MAKSVSGQYDLPKAKETKSVKDGVLDTFTDLSAHPGQDQE